MTELNENTLSVPCCPDVKTGQICNSLDFNYRLSRFVPVNDGQRTVEVEMIIHARIEVCRGGFNLGKLAYSTTLFPGEKVRLFTMDRRNSFTFDAESKLSYRHAQSYEEQFYLSSMSEFMSDLTIKDQGEASSKSNSSFESKGSTSGAFESLLFGASAKASGNYSSASTSDFLREISQHAQSSHRQSEQMTRTVNSVSIGEVNNRFHSQGESEDHFESSSREFSNHNKCHAVTYFFYQIDQEQTIRFTIQSIRRRVVDPAGNSIATHRPNLKLGEVSVIPTAVLATDAKRLTVEEQGRQSLVNKIGGSNFDQIGGVGSFTALQLQKINLQTGAGAAPLTETARQEALSRVDQDLVNAGILDKQTRALAEEVKAELSFELTFSLPTGGTLVKSCLDECSVCEPAMEKAIELDLERKQLENELLKRKIELLDQAQEYRCCPCEDEKEADNE
ncbi:MAG: hypothetical protein H6562_13470 [Lewinellaceae bacterium]|nr:hypothetical protein [Lewinella sp.]MCB9279894.1 hypothetical protein [Lewinellaceae bacterium]